MRVAERNTAAFPVGSKDKIKTRSLHALEIWQFISILLSALVTGVFWGTWLGLSRSIASFTPETFLTIGHAMIGNAAVVDRPSPQVGSYFLSLISSALHVIKRQMAARRMRSSYKVAS
jgi:hypothetical protein